MVAQWQTSTVPAMLEEIKARLDARREATPDGPMAGVVVTTAPSGDPIPDESIQLFGTNGDQAWSALGGQRRRETYTITGGIFITRRGAGPEVWDAVRGRVYALLAELERTLHEDPTLGFGARSDVQMATANLDQGVGDNGRWAAIDFTIAVVAELTRGTA